MGLGRWSVVGSSVMWHSGGSGCGHSMVVGSGILGQSLHGGGMVGMGFGLVLAQRLISSGGFYGGAVEFGFGF